MSALAAEVAAIRSRIGIGRRPGTVVLRADAGPGRAALDPIVATALDLREAQFRQAVALADDGRPVHDLLVGFFRGTLYALADAAGPVGDLGLEPMREHVVVGLDGPFAWEVLGAWSSPSAIGLPYLGAFAPRDGELVLRAGRTGEYGYLLVVPADRADDVIAGLRAAAAAMDPVEVSEAAIAHCALENWVFELGREGRSDLDALELQLTWRLDLAKDARGLDAIRAHREAGLRRRLTAIDAPGPVSAGDVVSAGDRAIGRVIASAPRLDGPGEHRVLAALDLPWAHAGQAYAIRAAGGPIQARTRSAPFVANKSLFVNPQRHGWAARDEVELPPGTTW